MSAKRTIPKPRPQIEVRTLKRYLDLFPAELELRHTGDGGEQGPEFAIFTTTVDDYWLVNLRQAFRVKSPEELGEVYGQFLITGDDGQDVTVGLYKLLNRPRNDLNRQ